MKQKLFDWFANWLFAWADMICGFLSVVTFNLYRPWWDFKIRIVIEEIRFKSRKNELNKTNLRVRSGA
jgi:hypothetical protein